MLNAYLNRIAFLGQPHADWATLDALQRHHLAAIPYENIDVLQGRPVDLSPPAILDKIIGKGRGGYCYEQNLLFEAALVEIGFDVRRVLGRVLWRLPADAPRPATSHLALVVRVDGMDWFADVGFGGSVPDRPLRLVADEIQQTRHDTYRFVPGTEGLQLTMGRGGQWDTGLELVAGAVEDADLDVANWYTSTYPQSWFRSALAVSLCTDEARYGLHNRQFSVRRPFAEADLRELDDAQLSQVLDDNFRLPSGLVPELPTSPISNT